MNKKKENINLPTNEEIIINNNEVVVKEAKVKNGEKKPKKDYSKNGGKIALFCFGVFFLIFLAIISFFYSQLLSDLFSINSPNDIGKELAIMFGAPIVLLLWVPIIILFFTALLFFIFSHRSKHKIIRILAPIFTLLTIVDLGLVMFYTYYIFQIAIK